MSDVIDLDRWLADRGLTRTYAESVAKMVGAKYPALTSALKAHRDVVCELELVALIAEIQHSDGKTCLPDR